MFRDPIPKRLKVTHLFSLRELIKPWRCGSGSFAHSEMVTERCRANNDSPDGAWIRFLKAFQYRPNEKRRPRYSYLFTIYCLRFTVLKAPTRRARRAVRVSVRNWQI